MAVLSITSHSEDQTAGLAHKLAASFVAGDVLILSGPLGSGKTTFVRALATARGIDENIVRSPSFAFVNEYGGEPPMYHFDLYRIGDIDELYEIGWDEYLSRSGIMVVEWGERAEELLPPLYYRIDFTIVSEQERQITITRVER